MFGYGVMMRFIFMAIFFVVGSLGGAYASELTLDEHVPISLKGYSSLELVQDNEGQPIEEAIAVSMSFDMWWLLVLVVIIAGIWFVWKKENWKKVSDDEKILLPRKPVELTAIKKASRHAAELRKIVDKPKLKLNIRKNVIKPEDLFEYTDLKIAYECYCSGENEKMLQILVKGFKHDPFDMPVYMMAMNILSESDKPLLELEKLVKTGLLLLRMKRPILWQEVSVKGRVLLPSLEDWFWQRQ